MNDILDIAKEVEFNEKAEAQAVYDYTELLKKVLSSDLEEETKQQLVNSIGEIVSDELNHQMKLGQLYVLLTGIEPNKD